MPLEGRLSASAPTEVGSPIPTRHKHFEKKCGSLHRRIQARGRLLVPKGCYSISSDDRFGRWWARTGTRGRSRRKSQRSTARLQGTIPPILGVDCVPRDNGYKHNDCSNGHGRVWQQELAPAALVLRVPLERLEADSRISRCTKHGLVVAVLAKVFAGCRQKHSLQCFGAATGKEDA